jgi:hypothetical protein
VEFTHEDGIYKLRAQILNDANTYLSSDTITVSNGWHTIEVRWQASRARRANDGFLTLWVDGMLAGTIHNVDNDTHTIKEARLGAVTE